MKRSIQMHSKTSPNTEALKNKLDNAITENKINHTKSDSDNTSINHFEIKELKTREIAKNLKAFISTHNIRESYFSQKILRSSFLTFKNIVDFPQDWSVLSSSFKLYYKRAFIFLK